MIGNSSKKALANILVPASPVMRAIWFFPPTTTSMAKFSAITGRYLYLDVDGIEYRVYLEEAGSGIPLVSPSGRGPKMRRSAAAIATSLMLASRLRSAASATHVER